MHHSMVVRLFKKIFEFTKQYYKFSVAEKMVNNISSAIKNIFIHSFIYKFFTSENYNVPKILSFSVIGKLESILHKILELLHPLYSKGIKGSSVLKFEDNIKKSTPKTKKEFILFVIIGVVLAFNLFSFINKNVYVIQLYISAIILIFTINVYFIDTNKVYQNSFIKKIVDSLIKI